MGFSVQCSTYYGEIVVKLSQLSFIICFHSLGWQYIFIHFVKYVCIINIVTFPTVLSFCCQARNRINFYQKKNPTGYGTSSRKKTMPDNFLHFPHFLKSKLSPSSRPPPPHCYKNTRCIYILLFQYNLRLY
jgi:hypothetical protein